MFYRYVMLLSAGLIALFGSSEVGLSGAGPIGCLTTATIAAYKWRQGRQPGEKVVCFLQISAAFRSHYGGEMAYKHFALQSGLQTI